MTHTGALASGIEDWFVANARDLPWRRPGVTGWGVLVSEVMLQQTPVQRVLPVYREWMVQWPDATAFAAAPLSDVLRAWGRLGYPRRALRLHDAAGVITALHGGLVPRDLDALLALPGIGDYTARAVACFAYGDRHEVVDTNVRRVLARAVCGEAEAWQPSRTRDLTRMAELLPRDRCRASLVNAGTMELGALICTARAPRCGVCPIRRECEWVARGKPVTERTPRRVQARFDGSDRQVRGIVLHALRGVPQALPADEVRALWSDAGQLARAVEGLASDGLVQISEDGSVELPS